MNTFPITSKFHLPRQLRWDIHPSLSQQKLGSRALRIQGNIKTVDLSQESNQSASPKNTWLQVKRALIGDSEDAIYTRLHIWEFRLIRSKENVYEAQNNSLRFEFEFSMASKSWIGIKLVQFDNARCSCPCTLRKKQHKHSTITW